MDDIPDASELDVSDSRVARVVDAICTHFWHALSKPEEEWREAIAFLYRG